MHEHMQKSFLVIENIEKQTREISRINQALERVRTLMSILTEAVVQHANEEETG